MNTSANSINSCLCTHCSADPVASCWAQTFCNCLEVWTKRQWKTGPFILLIAWRKLNGPYQPRLPHITLSFGIPCTSVHVFQYHHANSHVSLAGVCICRRAYWTVGTRYPCFLAMACAVQAISQSIAMPQPLPGFSVMCIKYKELRSCCTCCEREGCHILADENQRCY